MHKSKNSRHHAGAHLEGRQQVRNVVHLEGIAQHLAAQVFTIFGTTVHARVATWEAHYALNLTSLQRPDAAQRPHSSCTQQS